MTNESAKFVGAIIQNLKFGYLLQQRDDKAPSFPLCWSLFGGEVEPGETPEQAIIRELQEEIGIKSNQIKNIEKVQENIQSNGNTQIIFYLLINARLRELSLKEGQQMEYVKKYNLFNREFAFNIKEVLENFLKSRK
jgi:8-oxo-dGTP diphosphatase